MADKKQLPDEPVDILKFAESETAARTQWVKDEIAAACHPACPPPAVWYGRDDVIRGLAERFSISEIEAATAVDLACEQLATPDHQDYLRVSRKLMRMRLVSTRQLILRAIKEGRRESQFKVNEDTDTKRWVPFKEKRYHGIDMAAIGRLIEVDNALARLDGLDGTVETESSISILEELDQVLDAGTKRRVVLSLAQRVKNKTITDLSPEGKRRLDAAIEEGKRAKKVEAKVKQAEPEDVPEGQA
jgi:hypothetical protein